MSDTTTTTTPLRAFRASILADMRASSAMPRDEDDCFEESCSAWIGHDPSNVRRLRERMEEYDVDMAVAQIFWSDAYFVTNLFKETNVKDEALFEVAQMFLDAGVLDAAFPQEYRTGTLRWHMIAAAVRTCRLELASKLAHGDPATRFPPLDVRGIPANRPFWSYLWVDAANELRLQCDYYLFPDDEELPTRFDRAFWFRVFFSPQFEFGAKLEFIMNHLRDFVSEDEELTAQKLFPQKRRYTPVGTDILRDAFQRWLDGPAVGEARRAFRAAEFFEFAFPPAETTLPGPLSRFDVEDRARDFRLRVLVNQLFIRVCTCAECWESSFPAHLGNWFAEDADNVLIFRDELNKSGIAVDRVFNTRRGTVGTLLANIRSCKNDLVLLRVLSLFYGGRDGAFFDARIRVTTGLEQDYSELLSMHAYMLIVAIERVRTVLISALIFGSTITPRISLRDAWAVVRVCWSKMYVM